MRSGTSITLITGASRGIGLAVARRLVRQELGPLQLALAARDSAKLEQVIQELKTEARADRKLTLLACPMDVSSAASISQGMETLTRTFGPPDRVVLSAGIADSAALEKTTDEMFDRILSVNVRGAFQLLRATLPSMAKAGYGRAVLLGSIASKIGGAYISAYCASKHAVLGLTRALAIEYALHGVTVNCVCPGYVDTPMTTGNLKRMESKTGRPASEIMKRILERTPQRRLFSAEEVAALICFLLTEEAAGINGAALEIDGGEVAG